MPLADPPATPRDLEKGEQVLLGATRIWFARRGRSAEAAETAAFQAVERFFGFHGLSACAQSHHGLMRAGVVAGVRPLRVNGVARQGLTEDEAAIVHAVGCGQAGRSAQAAAILAGWLPPAAIRLTMPALLALADSLAAQGVETPVRPWRVDAAPRLCPCCAARRARLPIGRTLH